jgi:hypothetical protein
MPMSFAIYHLSLNTCNYLLPLQLRANPNPVHDTKKSRVVYCDRITIWPGLRTQ